MEKDRIISELIKKVDLLTKRIGQVEQEHAKLKQEYTGLKAENLKLKERLSKYETLKNSNNSSIPPSKDENRPKRKSLREKTGCGRVGKQAEKVIH